MTNMDNVKRPRRKPAAAQQPRPRKTTPTKRTSKPAASPVKQTKPVKTTDDFADFDLIADDHKEPHIDTKQQRKPWSRKRKVITTILGILLVLLLIAGIYAARIAHNTSSIFEGSIFDLFRQDALQTDANGRSNILIFGTSEDDPEQSGGYLADSIMMLSIDQQTKEGYTVSIPRDLWVTYDTACSVGREGKINAVYYCGLEAHNGDEREASMAFARKLSQVVGTDVQYYVAVNYTVVRGLVDSLGGIDVTIANNDPRGIYDISTGLRLANGTHHLDGDTALDLTRARNSNGGYGLPQGNFDREKNQQLVLGAVQDKALKSGTLLDPNKVLGITESLGTNIRTNIKGSELRTAIDVAGKVRSSELKSMPLNDPGNQLVTTGNYNGQSIVRPVKGLTDYSDIQRYLDPNRP